MVEAEEKQREQQSLASHSRKAKIARGKRILANREPKVNENVKKALFIRNTTTSAMVNSALADLYALKRPEAVYFQRRNSVHPFDGGVSEASLEFFSQRNDTSLLLVGSHSKKRPNSLIFIRMFDYHILDMVEVSITDYLSIAGTNEGTCRVGTKPCFLFQGEPFEQQPELKLFQQILLDFYRGAAVTELGLAGIESVIVVIAVSNRIYFRVYRVRLLKSNDPSTPRVELSLMGPSIDMALGRIRTASPELMKAALRMPKELKPAKVKNVSRTNMGDVVGQIHMARQDLDGMQTRKIKALKKRKLEE